MGKKVAKPNIPDKIANLHTIFILAVCILFGITNFLSSSAIIGVVTIATGVLVTAVSFLLKNKLDVTARGFLLSIVQLLVIIVISTAKHEMDAMFPLMLASIAISTIYFHKRCLITQWIIISVVSIAGIFLNDFFYGGAEVASLIKGILGMNIGAFFIMYLLSCSMNYIATAQQAKEEADRLVEQVNVQMEQTEKLAAQQRTVMENISSISATLNVSGEKINNIAASIRQSAEEQQATITGISDDVRTITAETENSLAAAEKASASASESTRLMNESNKEMLRMATAMGEIEESSNKIRVIVSTIEDIAFQTNILALNASIEAARAGAAGKGFAVVADEVRNLAGKSQHAVEDTAELIDSTLEAVHRGRMISDAVAERMGAVITSAEESAVHADSIAQLTEKQADAITAVKARIEQITEIINASSETAAECANAANEVAADTNRMDSIVSEFRA